MEYLGFWVTREGVSPTAKIIETMVDMDPRRNIKEVRRFILMINYYRVMWARRSHTLQASNKLTSMCVKFKWTSVEQEAFEEIKQIVAK